MKIEIESTAEKTGYQVKVIESLKSDYGEVNKVTISPILPTVHRAIYWVLHILYLDSIKSHPMGGLNVSKGDLE